MKVRASFASILEEADEDLGAALHANVKAVNARPEDEFVLRFMRRKNKKLITRVVPQSLIDGVRKLARRPDLRSKCLSSRLQVRAAETIVSWAFFTNSSRQNR